MITPALPAAPVSHGILAIRGADAARFLQGQLSADMEKLAPGDFTMAGLHNPQGRVVALLHVVRLSPEEFVAKLPQELLSPVGARLRKYVLRAKLQIEEHPGGHQGFDAASGFEVSELEAIRAGLPEVRAATSESFVAQMLNLDLLGAISFDKGCYTGQEVIARAHYRGRVKRRMQRWLNATDRPLAPGDAAVSQDGRALVVVRTADAGDGQQEILAVGTFGASSAATAEVAHAEPAVTVSGPLPLPYSLPD